MSKVQQGFECAAAAAATARRARDENMKPLLQSHFHIKPKQPRDGGREGRQSIRCGIDCGLLCIRLM